MKVSTFWHVPFPTPDELISKGPGRGLPARIAREFVRGMAGVPVGFHSYTWRRNFGACYRELVGTELPQDSRPFVSPGRLNVGRLRESARAADGKGARNHVLGELGLTPEDLEAERDQPRKERSQRILVVGRGDPKNGVLRALEAYKRILGDPGVQPKPTLLLVTSPTREKIDIYEKCWRDIAAKVKELQCIPGARVVKLDGSREITLAAQRIADIALVTALRGGRDLVAIEPVAVRENGDPPVVVVVSDGAAASETVGSGAIVVRDVGPDVSDSVAARQFQSALAEALNMSDRAVLGRYQQMRFAVLGEEHPDAWASALETAGERGMPNHLCGPGHHMYRDNDQFPQPALRMSPATLRGDDKVILNLD